MNKFRDDSNAQRDDIVAWFSSLPGLIVSAVVIGGFALWFLVSFGVDLFTQISGG